MPALKRLLAGVETAVAERRRKCGHNPTKHVISKGEVCLETRVGLGRKNYCRECALKMLENGLEDLAVLRRALE